MLWWLRGLFGCVSVHCPSLMRRATCVSDSSITSKGKQLRGMHAAHILIGRVILVVGWNAVLHCCCLLLGRVKNLQVAPVGPRCKNKYKWATIQNEKPRGIRPESRWDAGEWMGACKFVACSMRLCESHRVGVIALGLHYCAYNGVIKVTDATSVTSSEVWTMGTRGKRDRDH